MSHDEHLHFEHFTPRHLFWLMVECNGRLDRPESRNTHHILQILTAVENVHPVPRPAATISMTRDRVDDVSTTADIESALGQCKTHVVSEHTHAPRVDKDDDANWRSEKLASDARDLGGSCCARLKREKILAESLKRGMVLAESLKRRFFLAETLQGGMILAERLKRRQILAQPLRRRGLTQAERLKRGLILTESLSRILVLIDDTETSVVVRRRAVRERNVIDTAFNL